MPPGDSAVQLDQWVRSTFDVDPSLFASPRLETSGAAPAKGKGRKGGHHRGHKHKPVSAAPADPNSALSRDARDPQVWTQSVGPALTRQGPYKTGARIGGAPTGPATQCTGPDGKSVSVVTGADGRVAITRDPPPITEITFSGGGGKGVALPGAVKALAASGVLKGAKQISGASVGSMTAALLAAGVTPEAFQKISDDTKFGPLIKGDSTTGFNVSGDGLEDLVRSSMNSGIQGQISKFASDAVKAGTKVDQKTLDTLTGMVAKLKKNNGPTFGDLRILSKIIPDIKEVVITGTMTGKAPKPDPSHPPGEVKDVKPELVVFSADTQPDMQVARAVHASAALPPIFDKVDIPLASGETGRFEDGGVLNNAPTSDNLGTDRAVDPVPPTGKMTFIFEDDKAHEVMQGKATPSRSRMSDLVAGAPNSAAEYGKNRGLADRAEDVAMVPLKFDPPKATRPEGRGLFQRAADAVGDAASSAAGSVKDLVTHPLNTVFGDEKGNYTGLLRGTTNFDIAKDDRVKLQDMTEAETKKHLAKRTARETRSFASAQQMLACSSRDDLVAMAASKFPGARDALKFRDEVAKQVHALEALAAGGAGSADPKVQAILKGINGLTHGDQERVAFIGRELNRTGKLDGILAGAKASAGKGGPDLDGVAAGIAVASVLAAKKTAQRILKETLYPKMVAEGPDGVMGGLLAQMDTLLRDARSSQDINKALRIGIAYFSKKFDPAGLLGHKDFAQDLTKQLQPDD